MRNFFRSILLFSTILFFLIFGIDFIISYQFFKRSDFDLSSKPGFAIFGHSHSECAFDDSLIENFINLAESGESYFYTFFKLRKILEANPSIHTVFIEFTNNQINKRMDKWIWGDKYLDHRFPRYSSFMRPYDRLKLIINNPSGYLHALSLSFQQRFYRIFRGNYSFKNEVGGYLSLKKNLEEDIGKYISKNSDNKDFDVADWEISRENLNYLNFILDYCYRNNIEVVLIRSPQNELYSGTENEEIYQNILKDAYSDLIFLDFSDFPLNNSEYADPEHLNENGARVFSKWFNEFLNEDKLDIEILKSKSMQNNT